MVDGGFQDFQPSSRTMQRFRAYAIQNLWFEGILRSLRHASPQPVRELPTWDSAINEVVQVHDIHREEAATHGQRYRWLVGKFREVVPKKVRLHGSRHQNDAQMAVDAHH